MAVRRQGTDTSETRAMLLDITERLMVEKGYAAVTSRSVAIEAGVTPPLVHYYFRTVDDLFRETLRRRAEGELARQDRLLESDQPLRKLWAFNSHPTGTALMVEFMALANHRKSIQSLLAEYMEKFRAKELEVLEKHLQHCGVDPEEFPPLSVIVTMMGTSRAIVMERGIGVQTGHEETLAVVERLLTKLEGPAPKASRRQRRTSPLR